MIEAAIILSVSIVAGSIFAGFKMWLDRLHPPHKPEPSATELRALLEEGLAANKKEIDALAGKIGFSTKARLRE